MVVLEAVLSVRVSEKPPETVYFPRAVLDAQVMPYKIKYILIVAPFEPFFFVFVLIHTSKIKGHQNVVIR